MNIDDLFREMEDFQKRLMDTFFDDFEDLDKKIKSGELQGAWNVEPFEAPNIRGFIARGFFKTPTPLERPKDILPPLRPKRREPREPLYDITSDKDNLQIFIELPGVEEKDIQLSTKEKILSIKAGDFQTEIDLSSWIVDTEKMSTEYKNGVLKITMPHNKLDEQLI